MVAKYPLLHDPHPTPVSPSQATAWKQTALMNARLSVMGELHGSAPLAPRRRRTTLRRAEAAEGVGTDGGVPAATAAASPTRMARAASRVAGAGRAVRALPEVQSPPAPGADRQKRLSPVAARGPGPGSRHPAGSAAPLNTLVLRRPGSPSPVAASWPSSPPRRFYTFFARWVADRIYRWVASARERLNADPLYVGAQEMKKRITQSIGVPPAPVSRAVIFRVLGRVSPPPPRVQRMPRSTNPSVRGGSVSAPGTRRASFFDHHAPVSVFAPTSPNNLESLLAMSTNLAHLLHPVYDDGKGGGWKWCE